MNTLTPSTSYKTVFIFVGLCIIGSIITFHLLTPSLSFRTDRPVLDSEQGKQLRLPFKEIEIDQTPKPKKVKPTATPYSRRYDEERRGTCIIYALIAPTDGLYVVPGCYGKPSTSQYFSRGRILKVGRHWNKTISGCMATERLSNIVRNKRYGYDLKFPGGKIKFKDMDGIVGIPMNIQILDCFEKVTEGKCEGAEKNYIKMHGGPENLALNCCCR